MKQSRPGGRTQRNTLAVAQAVLQELQDGNFDFTFSDIADRAGVNQSTIYRRWPDKADLICEALTLHTSEVELPDTGNWAKDLKALVAALVKFESSPVEVAINQALITHPNESLELKTIDAWTPLFDLLVAPIKRAQERGEISDAYDALTLLHLIMSPIVLSGLFTKKPFSKRDAQELIDTVLVLTGNETKPTKMRRKRGQSK